eukprot:646627-Rhodomonas_salina.1
MAAGMRKGQSTVTARSRERQVTAGHLPPSPRPRQPSALSPTPRARSHPRTPQLSAALSGGGGWERIWWELGAEGVVAGKELELVVAVESRLVTHTLSPTAP